MGRRQTSFKVLTFKVKFHFTIHNNNTPRRQSLISPVSAAGLEATAYLQTVVDTEYNFNTTYRYKSKKMSKAWVGVKIKDKYFYH